MSDDLRVSDALFIPERELEWRFSTSGGPGGQHANRSATRVELSFDVTRSEVLSDEDRRRLLANLRGRAQDGVVTVVAADSRSQWRNRQLARARLARLVHDGLRRRRSRVATRPSVSARRKRLDSKRKRGDIKRQRQRPPVD